MTDTETFKQHSFSTENEQVEGYRRLSRLAIWSIPLGLLSALSMVSPLLWFVPVVAAAFAFGGLWVISRSNDITGRRLALAGLGLAILFGTWGMTWTISRRMIIDRQARVHAAEWFALMQRGETMKAHQLSINYYERLPAGASLEEHYAQTEPENNTDITEQPPGLETNPNADLEEFKTHGIPQILIDAGGEFTFEFVKNVTVLRDGQYATKVDHVFHVTFAGDHQPPEMDVKIELKRTIDHGKAYWQVGPLSDANEPVEKPFTP